MHQPTDRIAHTTAFVTPVVEHWLEREIAQWVHPLMEHWKGFIYISQIGLGFFFFFGGEPGTPLDPPLSLEHSDYSITCKYYMKWSVFILVM